MGRKKKKLNPVDASYIAGFYDGEGNVTIGIGFRKYVTRTSWFPFVQLVISNTESSPILFIRRKLINANILSLTNKTKCKNNYKYLQHWKCKNRKSKYSLRIVTPKEIIVFIDNILPFVKSKITKRQFYLMREACRFILDVRNSKPVKNANSGTYIIWTPERLNFFYHVFINIYTGKKPGLGKARENKMPSYITEKNL